MRPVQPQQAAASSAMSSSQQDAEEKSPPIAELRVYCECIRAP